MNNPIWKSRRFWLMVLDLVISLVLYFVPKYAPEVEADIKFLIVALQIPVTALIIAYTHEDVAKIKAFVEKYQAELNLEETKLYHASELENKK